MCLIRTDSYACVLCFKSARVIILDGPLSPKFIAEALVASEKVGEGGEVAVVAVEFRRGVTVDVLIARERRERALGIVQHSVRPRGERDRRVR